MATNKLTSKFCETAPAGTHFDGQGLYLLVKPDGKRYWHLSFRLDGKKALLSFGPYPKVTLEKARKARVAALELIEQGIHPAEHKKEKKLERIRETEKEAKEDEMTFEQITRKLHASKAGKVADESRNRMLRQLELHVFPVIGHKHILEIEGSELLTLFQDIAKKTNHGRLMTYMAQKLCQWSGEVFDFAHVLNQNFFKNPCRAVSKHLPKHERKHMARICMDELANFIRDLLQYKGHPTTKAAMWVMLYTAMRTISIRRAVKKDMDLQNGIWHRQPEKSDKSVFFVPLPHQAVKVIEGILQYTGESPDDLVFPSMYGPHRMMSEAAICQAIERMGYNMVGHGLRGLVDTCLNELGFPPHIVDAQLGHKKGKVEAAYNFSTYEKERREMMQKWADYLDTLIQKAKKVA